MLPELVQMNAQAVQHMQTAMEQLQQVRDYLENETLSLEKMLISGEKGNVKLDARGLEKLPQAVRMRLIRKAVWKAAGACKDITAAHLQAVADLLEKQTGKYVQLPYGLTAARVYDRIEIMGKRKAAGEINIVIDAVQLPEKLQVGDWNFAFKKFPYDGNTDKIPRKMYTKWFDYDKIKDSLAIRNRRKGDCFLLDAMGHHKKLEDYFVNEKIPASRRDEQLLLAGEEEIFWIIGGRMAYGAGVSDTTRWVLEITASNSSH